MEQHVTYIVHEAELARAERHIRRLWLALIVTVTALGLSNCAWILALIH